MEISELKQSFDESKSDILAISSYMKNRQKSSY